jgi:7,8-dihydroneopterin 2',3'-cyclic phosphate phosphodiesterase
MKELIKLADKIGDEKLKKMVVDFLQDIKLSNKHFKKYPKMDLKDAATPFSVGGMMSVERDVLNHTRGVVALCESSVKVVDDAYGLKLDKDSLIAAAILHDVMKLFEWKRGEMGIEHSGIMLDHTMLGVAELYHRGFPEEVIHIVASHFGESGPTPPRTFEALIHYQIDSLMSLVEFRMGSAADQQQQVQLLLLNDDMIKKIGGEPPEPEKQPEPEKKKPK